MVAGTVPLPLPCSSGERLRSAQPCLRLALLRQTRTFVIDARTVQAALNESRLASLEADQSELGGCGRTGWHDLGRRARRALAATAERLEAAVSNTRRALEVSSPSSACRTPKHIRLAGSRASTSTALRPRSPFSSLCSWRSGGLGPFMVMQLAKELEDKEGSDRTFSGARGQRTPIEPREQSGPREPFLPSSFPCRRTNSGRISPRSWNVMRDAMNIRRSFQRPAVRITILPSTTRLAGDQPAAARGRYVDLRPLPQGASVRRARSLSGVRLVERSFRLSSFVRMEPLPRQLR